MYNANKNPNNKRAWKSPDQYSALLQKGPFVPSEEYLKHLEKRQAYKMITHSLPKSSREHGIRINYGIVDAMLVDDVRDSIKNNFEKAVSIDTKFLKGFIDLGFQTKDEADDAALVQLIIKNQKIPVIRTRYSGDQNIFITIDQIPTNYPRKWIIQQLESGLSGYGEVLQFEMQTDDVLPNLAMSKAIAIIAPNEEVRKDKDLIPRRAHLIDSEDKCTETFRIYPEDATPVCSHCDSVGHRIKSCPFTVEGLQRQLEDTTEDISDKDNPENGEEFDEKVEGGSFSYEWGHLSSYLIIDGVTNRERKQAKEFLKNQKVAEDQPKGVEDKAQQTQSLNNQVLIQPEPVIEIINQTVDNISPISTISNENFSKPQNPPISQNPPTYAKVSQTAPKLVIQTAPKPNSQTKNKPTKLVNSPPSNSTSSSKISLRTRSTNYTAASPNKGASKLR